MRSRFAIVMLAAMSMAQVPSGPPSRVPREGTSSGARPVSPEVVASWIARVSPQQAPAIEILVLWRGTPGWFTRGQGGMTSGGGRSSGSVTTVAQRSMFGGMTLELEWTTEGQTRSLQLQGRPVPLDGSNVVLVDQVDNPHGPAVIGTLYVDPTMTEAHLLTEVLKRSPEILAFLRCDTQLPDSFTQQVMSLLCAQVTP